MIKAIDFGGENVSPKLVVTIFNIEVGFPKKIFFV
jgi:hypothetical protein